MASRSTDADQIRRLMKNGRRDFVRHAVLRGGAGVLLTVTLCLSVALALDFLFSLAAPWRLFGLVASSLVALIAIWRRLLQPLRRGMSDRELGAATDLARPELNEAVATLVSIESDHATAAEAGHDSIRRRMWQQTLDRLAAVPERPVMDSRVTAQRCGTAAVVVILTLAPLAAWHTIGALLLQRFLVPLGNHETATDLVFDIMAPGQVAGRGTDVVFAARPCWRTGGNHQRPEEAILHVATKTGHNDSLPMKYDHSSGLYSVTIRNISNTVSWRVSTGRAATREFQLLVVDLPQLTDAALSFTPPAYTSLPASTYPSMTGVMEVPAGSRVQMNLQFNKPVISAAIEWQLPGSEQAEPSGDTPDRPQQFLLDESCRRASLKFFARTGGTFQLKITDRHQLFSSDQQHRDLRVIPDEPPVLKVYGLQPEEEARPDDIVPIVCHVSDDWGVNELELQIRTSDNEPLIIPATEYKRGQPDVEHTFRLNLTEHRARKGSVYNLSVRATDTHQPESHEVWSSSVELRIDPNAAPAGSKTVSEETQQVLQQLEQVRRELKETANSVVDLQRQDDARWKEAGTQTAQRLNEQTQQSGLDLQRLAEDVARHPLMKSSAQDLVQQASHLKTEAATALRQASDQDRDASATPLQQAKSSLQLVRKELSRVIQDIRAAGELEQDLMELNRLAAKAENLSRDADQLRRDQDHQPAEVHDAEQTQLEARRQDITRELRNLLTEQQRLQHAAQRALQQRLQQVSQQSTDLAFFQKQIHDGLTNVDSTQPVNDVAQGVQNTIDRVTSLATALQQLKGRKLPGDRVALAAKAAQAGEFAEAARELKQTAQRLQQDTQEDDSMQKFEQKQLERMQTHLRQTAGLLDDLQKKTEARLAVKLQAEHTIVGQAQPIANELQSLNRQMRLPAIGMTPQSPLVVAAEKSADSATESSLQAASALQSGQPEVAAASGRAAARALRRVSELTQQTGSSEDTTEERIQVPPNVGQKVTDALQHLTDAAQTVTDVSSKDEPDDASQSEQSADLSSGPSGRNSSSQPDESGTDTDDETSEPDDATGDTNGNPASGNHSSESEPDQRTRQLAEAAAALSSAAQQSLPGPAAMSQGGGSPGSGPIDDIAGLAADLATDRPTARQQREWARLNEKLGTGLLSGEQETGDERYARLIRAYFRNLAAQATKAHEGK